MDDYLPIRYMDLLATELIVMILGCLDPRDLLRNLTVCRRFRDAIESSPLLKYSIALARVGAVDNSNNSLSLKDKLKRLESQEKAWLNLTFARRDTIHIPARFGPFDLCSGVLVGARALAPEDNVDDVDANVQPLPDGDEENLNARQLLGTTLPSVLSDDTDVRSWSRDVGFPVYGLGIDTQQNLAIVIQRRTSQSAMRLTCFGFQMLRRGIIENSEEPFQIHLLALSTFEPHPLATQRIYEHHTDVRVSQISVRCMGNLAGVMFHSFEAELFQQTLLIFDWTTGITKACIESVKEGRFFDDFGFVTSDTLVLPVRKPGPATLDIYKFDTRKVERRSERISRGSLPTAVRVASFYLPAMRQPLEVSVNPICCNTEPPIPHRFYAKSSPTTPGPRCPPFYQDGENSLLSFSFMVCHGHSAQSVTPLHERFTLVVQRRALLKRIDDALRPANGRWVGAQWKTMYFPWNEWGPSSSRWLTMKHLSWACFMSGTRLILSPIIPEDRSLCHLRVLDFNPAVVEKEKLRQQQRRSQQPSYCVEEPGCSKGRTICKGKGKRRESDVLEDADAMAKSDIENLASQSALVKLVDEPGRIPAGKLWAQEVHSNLPYRQVTTKESFPYANVVIDDERIGGILVGEDGELTDVEVLTMYDDGISIQ
ncbi:hypothetical protein M407DRAFT_234431 [Tulasnella calospora MUT 4182]|uniref:F-box domain-containing protein n=1 Tax=Tulasnella calospora MUT 4182 TaxID=1051891 RepID=A0A0C3QUX3_9AGAM|nr:hypothetical protein M407DRAFT_234431 [Tulasnella calospora MUT 4182]